MPVDLITPLRSGNVSLELFIGVTRFIGFG